MRPVVRNDTENVSVSWRWIAGIFAALLVALCGGWAGTVQLRLTAVETAIARIAAVETRMNILEDKHSEIRSSLRDIQQAVTEMRQALMQHRLTGGEPVPPRNR